METFDLDIARATMLETLGRTSEAADLHLEEGRTLEAITLLIADPNNQELVRRGSEWLLQGLWKNLSFATVVSDQSSPILSGLLALANKLDDKFLSENDSNEVRSVSVSVCNAYSVDMLDSYVSVHRCSRPCSAAYNCT